MRDCAESNQNNPVRSPSKQIQQFEQHTSCAESKQTISRTIQAKQSRPEGMPNRTILHKIPTEQSNSQIRARKGNIFGIRTFVWYSMRQTYFPTFDIQDAFEWPPIHATNDSIIQIRFWRHRNHEELQDPLTINTVNLILFHFCNCKLLFHVQSILSSLSILSYWYWSISWRLPSRNQGDGKNFTIVDM